MKRFIFILIAALPLISQARDIPAGTFQVSGATSLDFVSSEADVEGFGDAGENNSWEARAAAGYYFVPNFAIGFLVDHESSETEIAGQTSDSSTTTFGPQLLFNLSLSEVASLQLGGGVVYATSEQDDFELDGLGWNVNAGVSFFLHPAISLDATIGYEAATLEDDAGTDLDLSGFGVGLGFSLYFGK